MLARTPSAYTPYVDMLRFRFGSANNATLLLRSLLHIDPARRQRLVPSDVAAAVAPSPQAAPQPHLHVERMLQHAYFAPMHIDSDGVVQKVLVPQARHLRTLSVPRVAFDEGPPRPPRPSATAASAAPMAAAPPPPLSSTPTRDELRRAAERHWTAHARHRFVPIGVARPRTLAATPVLRVYEQLLAALPAPQPARATDTGSGPPPTPTPTPERPQ